MPKVEEREEQGIVRKKAGKTPYLGIATGVLQIVVSSEDRSRRRLSGSARLRHDCVESSRVQVTVVQSSKTGGGALPAVVVIFASLVTQYFAYLATTLTLTKRHLPNISKESVIHSSGARLDNPVSERSRDEEHQYAKVANRATVTHVTSQLSFSEDEPAIRLNFGGERDSTLGIASMYPLASDSLTPPQTPPWERMHVHNWPEPEFDPEESIPAKQYRNGRIETGREDDVQDVLLLHAPKQRYAYQKRHPRPSLKEDREMLVAVEVVGLNPIDWKAPDYGFGLPNLPCISGRDFAGRVAIAPRADSRFKVGDKIMAISTDYRDSRKSAFQQYSVVSDFNACKLPSNVTLAEAAPLGVAYVAAALALGICMGMDFVVQNGGPRGPDLLRTVRSVPRSVLGQDVRAECFDGIRENERAREGDWIAIWGGSSASGVCAVQLAKLAGLKVIAVADVARSGERMLKHGADLLVDRLDSKRAISIVKGITKGRLRFGLDTIGKDTAALLAQAMQSEDKGTTAHLVGLTGLPKEKLDGVSYHSVPIKAFHEAEPVGEGLTIWLEKLLEQKLLATPDIEIAGGGLEGINAALDKLRNGTVNGPRIVVPLC